MKSRVKSTVWNDSPVRERFISDPKASVPTRILSLPEHGLIAPQKTCSKWHQVTWYPQKYENIIGVYFIWLESTI